LLTELLNFLGDVVDVEGKWWHCSQTPFNDWLKVDFDDRQEIDVFDVDDDRQDIEVDDDA
jgi:hypothetical protein